MDMASKRTSTANRNGSRWIQPWRRLAIYLRDGFACQYCGRDLRTANPFDVTLDHLYARSAWGYIAGEVAKYHAAGRPRLERMAMKAAAELDEQFGGQDDNRNLITACRSCNSSRQDKWWRDYATGGAIERIEVQRELPINATLAKAIIAGTAGDPRVEAMR